MMPIDQRTKLKAVAETAVKAEKECAANNKGMMRIRRLEKQKALVELLSSESVVALISDLESLEAKQAKPCKWQYDSDHCLYRTSCGQHFFFDTGDATENHFRFCPFCGGALVVEGVQGETRDEPTKGR